MRVGGVRVEVASRFEEGRSLNDNSIVLRLLHGKWRCCSPATWRRSPKRTSPGSRGDPRAGAEGPHHGSRTSSTEAFLRRVEPAFHRVLRGRGEPVRVPESRGGRADARKTFQHRGRRRRRRVRWADRSRAFLARVKRLLLESERGEAVQRMEIAAHRRRPRLPPRVGLVPGAAGTKFELPAIPRCGRGLASRSRRRTGWPAPPSPGDRHPGSFSVPSTCTACARATTRTDPCPAGDRRRSWRRRGALVGATSISS